MVRLRQRAYEGSSTVPSAPLWLPPLVACKVGAMSEFYYSLGLLEKTKSANIGQNLNLLHNVVINLILPECMCSALPVSWFSVFFQSACSDTVLRTMCLSCCEK